VPERQGSDERRDRGELEGKHGTLGLALGFLHAKLRTTALRAQAGPP
jgi:hypothetical protein